MNRELILHADAKAEILQALTWYGERSRVAARAFVQELNSTVSLAVRSPETWPRSHGDTRHIVFPRFPFNLFFRMRGETIEIVAVAHQRRRPSYWHNR
jgi:plasmid stabilization system protein ParE